MKLSGIYAMADNGSKAAVEGRKRNAGQSSFKSCLSESMSSKITGEEAAKPWETKEKFQNRLEGKKGAPYSYLADETGMIIYNGVTFYCDEEKNSINLGDVSNPKDVITIPLSEGGCLKVNRDNIDDLARAIGMFSPEDVNRILRALSQDAKAQKALEEIKDEKERVGGLTETI